MMGLPALPRKLPSRNWLIFWTLTGTLTATIIYDRREKRKATARWAASVAHLAKEPLPANNASAMPRKLTVYLAAPPGDGLRTAQDHFREYVKPVLAASGLDWEFRQGRQQGDIRAVVAEEVRKRRRRAEAEEEVVNEADLATTEEHIEQWRRQHGIAEYDGVRGDIVIGRHTWKEYLRGLHEGWLGPLRAPPHAQPDPEPEVVEGEDQEKRPKRPAQPKPYNSIEDYATAHLPTTIPEELAPSTPLPFPHILGFLNTPIRTYRYLTRRRLADEIGRDVAAACLCTYREYKELSDANLEQKWEQQAALAHEEGNWVKSVWKPDEEAAPEKKADTAAAADDASPTAEGSELVDGSKPQPTTVKKDKIWPKPIVLDPRIAMRMRRFEIQPEDEQRARDVVVPEEEIEGVIKGSLRSLWRWGTGAFEKKEKIPNVGEVD
ncbi:mitochondrial import inner membrane translocase subunit tim54 [Gnomoniopsis smithogilvyi]|uniref:Mitochondrial import inner membrane translocase subunit TIM54 n=1 Tax=Gnomoniopsis smithogilvyi TaxID=1191159 RepID=A0A9W9CS29_9PEZI|nr:mitochondrial import inner membrane translocase subunit tim54 [Gnomoniopsis smithogilvyi]